MNRFVTFITCLVSTLLLIPLHGECSVTAGYEPEVEVECIIATSTQTIECTAGYSSASFFMPRPGKPGMRLSFTDVSPEADTATIPLSILLCNFRE